MGSGDACEMLSSGLRRAAFTMGSTLQWKGTVGLAGVLALSLADVAHSQATDIVSVPYHWEFTVTGTTSASVSIHGFFANTLSGGASVTDTRGFSGNVSVRLVHTPPTDGILRGTLPTSVSLNVSAAYYGAISATVPSEDTTAYGGVGPTTLSLSGFTFGGYGADSSLNWNTLQSKAFSLGDQGSLPFTGQIKGEVVAPSQYTGNVFADGTLSLTFSFQGPSSGSVDYEVPCYCPPGIPEPEDWALASAAPLVLWGIFRRVRSCVRA